jgi:hypothetical protein
MRPRPEAGPEAQNIRLVNLKELSFEKKKLFHFFYFYTLKWIEELVSGTGYIVVQPVCRKKM